MLRKKSEKNMNGTGEVLIYNMGTWERLNMGILLYN